MSFKIGIIVAVLLLIIAIVVILRIRSRSKFKNKYKLKAKPNKKAAAKSPKVKRGVRKDDTVMSIRSGSAMPPIDDIPDMPEGDIIDDIPDMPAGGIFDDIPDMPSTINTPNIPEVPDLSDMAIMPDVPVRPGGDFYGEKPIMPLNPGRPDAYLIEKFTGRVIPAEGKVMYAGRSQHNDIQLNAKDMCIHGQSHVVLNYQGDSIALKCLKENGVIVNGAKCRKANLKSGDNLVVGETEYEVIIGRVTIVDDINKIEDDYKTSSSSRDINHTNIGDIKREEVVRQPIWAGTSSSTTETSRSKPVNKIDSQNDMNGTRVWKRSDILSQTDANKEPKAKVNIIFKADIGEKIISCDIDALDGRTFGRSDFPDPNDATISRKMFTLIPSEDQLDICYLPKVGCLQYNGVSGRDFVVTPGSNEFQAPTVSFVVEYITE